MMYYEDYTPIYESWIVDECEERLYKCSDYSDEQISGILSEHEEYHIRCLPAYM